MKKTLLFLCLSICAVAILFGTTLIMAKNSSTNNSANKQLHFIYNSDDVKDIESMEDIDIVYDTSNEQEDNYEVIEFVEPDKTVYSMSDVYTQELGEIDGEQQFIQQINLDNAGMSMTVKNTQTGKTKKYEYSYYYFNLDGEDIKCEDTHFNFYLDIDANVLLTPDEYTVYVNLITDDGDNVMYPMKIQLVE